MILCVNLNPCVDKTLYVDRLHPNAIQSASRVSITVGGKANNVARLLSAYGRDAVAMNFFGGETGRLCERLLREDDHLPTETVWTKAPTREIVTLYEAELKGHTDIKEPSPVILPPERDEFLEKYQMRLQSADWVVFGGSAPCPCVDDLPARFARLAAGALKPFVLDTSGTALALGLEEHPFMVKPNRAEAQALLGYPIKDEATALAALDQLSKKAELAVLSLGEEGFLAAYGGARYRVRPPKVDAVNAVGSGDALVALIVMGIIDKKPFEETLARGAAAAAANAASVLACKITPEDVEPLVALSRVERL